MNLLSIKTARAIWLMQSNDINPRGQNLLPLLVGLVERYRFGDVPNIQDIAKNPQQGIKLRAGVVTVPKIGEVAADVSIFNDGFVVDTRTSTEVSDYLIEDMFAWAVKEFGIQVPRAVTRQYLSEFYFEFDRPLSLLNPRLATIAKKITSKFPDDERAVFEFSGLSFGREWTGGRTHPQFRIERVEGTSTKDNRYWAHAPLRTDDHIALVQELLSIVKR